MNETQQHPTFNNKMTEEYNNELEEVDDEYSDEGEEDEEDEDIDVHTLFDEANAYIESLKKRLQISETQNSEDSLAIESLRKEVGELQKINDNLESELYKYQYDVNRITDVLMNEAYPSKEELEEEQNAIQEMSQQETNLYNLLKKAAELRATHTHSDHKIAVLEKDVEELMAKQSHLQEVEQIKNEISVAFEHEKQRANDLELMCAEKTHAFQAIIEEKEGLVDTISKVQAEKEELKGTLDTLHQLRDQEEEEIEKTLDEAKSIIQKLEEKLHHKDDKIKRYKEKIANIERDKADVDNKLLSIEDEFRDKEKNMKLKLLWAQMEKKDLATTILKLENSSHSIHPTHADNRRSSYSEERIQECRGPHRNNQKRNSENFQHRGVVEDNRSGSRNRTSLRRKNIEQADPSHIQERSKSVISVDSNGVTQHVEFNLGNISGEGPEMR